MKFMHISDLHLGKRVHDFSLIDDQKYILEDIINKLEDNNIKTLALAGDIYDKANPSIEAMKLFEWFINTLQKKDITVLIISGNHDSNARISYMSDIIEKNNIFVSKAFTGIIEKIKIEDVNFYFFPFLKPQLVRPYFEDVTDYNSMMQYLVSTCDINKEEKNVALVHQFITGSITSESEELSIGGIDNIDYKNFDNFDYVALGHLHRPQKIKKDTIRYSGSILKYSFSEANDKKSCVVIDTKDFSFELLELVAKHDMVELVGYYDELVSREYYKKLNLENYYHITLLDEENIFDGLNKLRTIYKKVMKLDYNNKRTATKNNISAKKLKSPFDFFNELYQLQNNSELNKEQVKIVNEALNEIWEQK